MTLGEITELNQIIHSSVGKANQQNEIYVDNLHSPYAEFSESYILPAVSHNSVDFDSAKKFIHTLVKFIPEAIDGCNVLPEPRPKRESGKLVVVKKLFLDSKEFLYVMKLEPTYLGGANHEQIQEKATQERNASIKTNRIYFSTRIIPVEKITEENGQITDFQAKSYDMGNFQAPTSTEGLRGGKKTVSELFDEIDFADVMQTLKDNLSVNKENWDLGKIYEPVSVEYLTISLRFLSLSQKEIFEDFSSFKNIFNVLYGEKEIPKSAKDQYAKWMSRYYAERTASSSGNMRWKINRK
ncbi:MAG: hypothetical protein IT569_06820 [Leptospiraceae bacterium]|nr:hypothetical protein [Leptospiraceae bacterium]